MASLPPASRHSGCATGASKSPGPPGKLVSRYEASLDAKSDRKGKQRKVVEASALLPVKIPDVQMNHRGVSTEDPNSDEG